MGNYLSVILEALAVGEALPGAIENTLLILARLRRDAGARRIQPAAARPANRHTILGTIRGAFSNLRRREPTVRETDITDEAVRELAQWFQRQYNIEALIDEEAAGWAEEMEMM